MTQIEGLEKAKTALDLHFGILFNDRFNFLRVKVSVHLNKIHSIHLIYHAVLITFREIWSHHSLKGVVATGAALFG